MAGGISVAAYGLYVGGTENTTKPDTTMPDSLQLKTRCHAAWRSGSVVGLDQRS